MAPRLAGPLLLISALAASGCALVAPRLDAGGAPPARVWKTTVILHGASLNLHLAEPRLPVPRALVVYASGDGGWFGTATSMFRGFAGDGYATAGFSARAFLHIERPSHAALDGRQLAADYGVILSRARAAFGLASDTPAILAGWSRGAAFAVIAGSEPALRAQVRGVLAIGLGDGEDLAVDEMADDDTVAADPAAGARRWPFDTYDRLKGIEPIRAAVIQATGDQYLPATRARSLFGSDTSTRRFFEIRAGNHRFSGGTATFSAVLAAALSWIASGGPPATPSAARPTDPLSPPVRGGFRRALAAPAPRDDRDPSGESGAPASAWAGCSRAGSGR